MSPFVFYADAVGKAVEVAAVWISSMAIGSGIGITAAVLERKSNKTITRWGYLGTAFGCVFGFLLMLCAWVALERS